MPFLSPILNIFAENQNMVFSYMYSPVFRVRFFFLRGLEKISTKPIWLKFTLKLQIINAQMQRFLFFEIRLWSRDTARFVLEIGRISIPLH